MPAETFKIKFDRTTMSLGRNGKFKTSGIWVRAYTCDETLLILQPITSKGVPGRCEIEVPADKAREVGEALLAFASKKRKKK